MYSDGVDWASTLQTLIGDFKRMDSDKKWLVKSSDLITGPFEFNQVVDNIFSGDVHLLDEIKGPFERWRVIKDDSLFAAAIERLKATTYSKREQTVTGTLDIGTKTHELTKTHTLTTGDEQSQTPPVNEQAPKPWPHQKNEEKTMVQGRSVKSPLSNPAPYPVRPVQDSTRSLSVFFISFLLFALAGGAFLVYESSLQANKPMDRTQTAEQLSDEAIGYLKTGEYQKALSNFILAYNLSGQDPNIVLEMAPLSVQFDGQFSHVELMVENLLATRYKKDFMKRGRNIVGLTHSYRGRYRDAIKSYEESLEVDGEYFPAMANQAYSAMKMGDPEKATQIMKKAQISHGDNPIAHYLYIRSLIETGLKTGSKNLFEEALSVSQQYDQKFSDLKQEVFFLKSIARKEMGASRKEIEIAVKNFLRVDSELTTLHVHNVHIDFQSFNWIDFAPHCNGLRDSLDVYLSALLEGFCFLKSNRVLEAKKVFENQLAEHNNDGILQGLYAASLLKLEELSQAKNVLGFINQIDDKQPVVETILRGCLVAHDYNCASAVFKGRHSQHISLLYSHWGNSAIHKVSNPSLAKSSIDLGLEVSPHFAPLLKLKGDL